MFGLFRRSNGKEMAKEELRDSMVKDLEDRVESLEKLLVANAREISELKNSRDPEVMMVTEKGPVFTSPLKYELPEGRRNKTTMSKKYRAKLQGAMLMLKIKTPFSVALAEWLLRVNMSPSWAAGLVGANSGQLHSWLWEKEKVPLHRAGAIAKLTGWSLDYTDKIIRLSRKRLGKIPRRKKANN